MSAVDTSPEAVERLAARCAADWYSIDPEGEAVIAATLRALSAQRNYAWTEMKNAQAYMRIETTHAEQAEAERDAALKGERIEIALRRSAQEWGQRCAEERDAARAEVEKLRGAWLRVIRAENSCAADGACINAKRCGCVEEQKMLVCDYLAALAHKAKP